MNADGNEQKRLTKNPADDAIPSWSPDGKKIAFISKRDGNPEIYIMNADGSEQERLTNNPAWDVNPSWSPFLGSEKSASALGVVKGRPDANEQGAKNCLKIKYLDLSERLIYDWSFRYFYLEYDSPPPKGYWYAMHGRENEKEKMSHTLYLISGGRFAEKHRVQILSDEIDRFRMKWKKRKIPSQREEGNLERTSLLLLTIDGRTFALDYHPTDKYWTEDISPFADKDKYHTNIHLYIVGKERKNDQLIDYSLNLGYDRSILFDHNPSKIPLEIAAIKTESGAPNRPETELPKEDVSPTVSVEQIEQEPAREDRLPKEPVSLQEELYKQTKIAFTSKRDGNLEIYVMNADGSEQKRLTNNPAPDMAARWSPDGKKIAFMSKRDGNTDIYVMNTDGSEQKRLTNNPAPDAFPSWSPDGKKIAFSSKRDGNAEIYVMNTDGSEQKRLTNNPADDGTPSWSPHGKKIAFASTMDGNPEIYIMNADGNDQKRLTNNPANDGVPSWSPDGKKIAFTSQRDGNVDIYLMNADGSEQKRLTSNPAWDMSSSWSPFLGSEAKEEPKKEDVSPIVSVEQIEQEPAKEDRLPKESVSLQEELYKQTKIAFMSERDGNVEIYVMNADGSEQERLTNNPAVDTHPFWAPDGKKIAFNSERDGNFEIYLMNADGSEQKRLTNNPAIDGFPSWSPHGKKIAFGSTRDGNFEIYLMNADRTKQERLTNNPAVDTHPSWSPGGKKIAFNSNRDGNTEIYVMDANGSEKTNLTNNPADDALPSWSPDGKKIAFQSTRDGNLEIYIMNADGTEQKRLTNNPALDGSSVWSPFLGSEK